MVEHLMLSAWIIPTHREYNVKFHQNVEVETMLTHDPSMVDSWITTTLTKNETRLHRLIVGLDVEWTPNFVKGCHHSVALFQLCVGRRCLVYQIHLSEGIPTKLRRFLENRDYTFVGAGIKQDADKLERD